MFFPVQPTQNSKNVPLNTVYTTQHNLLEVEKNALLRITYSELQKCLCTLHDLLHKTIYSTVKLAPGSIEITYILCLCSHESYRHYRGGSRQFSTNACYVSNSTKEIKKNDRPVRILPLITQNRRYLKETEVLQVYFQEWSLLIKAGKLEHMKLVLEIWLEIPQLEDLYNQTDE